MILLSRGSSEAVNPDDETKFFSNGQAIAVFCGFCGASVNLAMRSCRLSPVSDRMSADDDQREH